jgi:hypothetical protein
VHRAQRPAAFIDREFFPMHKLLLAALLAASFGARADTNLVTNGSFEEQLQAAGSWNVYTALDGWSTVSGSGIELRNALVGTAYAGSNFIELDSNDNSAMAQTLTTVAGAQYALSFAYSARPGVAADSNPIEVLWNGASVTTVSADGSGFSDNVWSLYSVALTGTGSDTLSFRAIGTSDGLGGALDSVAVIAVAEPSTWMTMIAGFAVIGLALGRRRSAG